MVIVIIVKIVDFKLINSVLDFKRQTHNVC